MVEKATYAGIGLTSSILPGVALALLAVDLAATTQLRSEMVYQIAVAYGLDLKDLARVKSWRFLVWRWVEVA